MKTLWPILFILLTASCSQIQHTGKAPASTYGIEIQVSCKHTRSDGSHDIYFGYNNPGEEKFVFHSRLNRVTPVAYDWWGGSPLWTYKPGNHEKAFALAGVRHLEIVRWQLGNQYADVSENTPECKDIGDIDTASL